MNTIRDNDEEEILEEVEEILEEVEEILEEVEEVEEINNNLPARGDREREYVPNHRRSLRNTGISSDQWLPTTRSRRQSSLFSMAPPTTAPPPRGPPIAVSPIPHPSISRIRELDYHHVINHSTDRYIPSSTRSRRTCCNSCGEDNTLMSRKHMTCYDCLVHFLTTSKIFVQGFDITSKRDSQMCIVCLDTVKHIGSRYVICIDCLITRLGDLNLLKFTESDDIHPLYVAIDTSYETGSVDWQRKKYFPCDICSRDKIEDTRTERVCMDCLMDKLLDSPYFTKVKRRIYS
jgi:hypothetical protein